MSKIRVEIKPPQCEATKDGRRCERDREPAHTGHWYTHWTHKNQYGSYPSYAVEWSTEGGEAA